MCENQDLYSYFKKFANKNIEKNVNIKNMILNNDNENNYNKKNFIKNVNIKLKKERNYRNERNQKEPLKHYFNSDNDFEAGIDEAGRGPLFGRVYVACVILPKESGTFNYSLMKDSKRFTSKKKLMEVYNHIIENCVDYSICYKDEKEIDKINIRAATLQCMHDCIDSIKTKPDFLLVDGCDFNVYNGIEHECIEGGDNWYCSIAAASILAKVARDTYVEELCKENPELDDYYSLSKNKGYGTKAHLDGLKTHGLSKWHRKTFGICKTM